MYTPKNGCFVYPPRSCFTSLSLLLSSSFPLPTLFPCCRPSDTFLAKVRHNDIHRAPLDYLSADDIDRFYEYHKSLTAILRCELPCGLYLPFSPVSLNRFNEARVRIVLNQHLRSGENKKACFQHSRTIVSIQ